MKKDITTTELFDAIGTFSEEVDRQFKEVKQQFKGIDAQFKGIDAQFKEVDRRFEQVDRQFKEIRSEMATKNDLFAVRDDIRQEIGRIISLFSPIVYKEDHKLNTLMERLVSKRVLTRSDVKDLLDSHPLAP